MAFAAIKIEECAVHESRFRDGDKYWLATQLIEQAKDLPVVEIPLCAIPTGSKVWEPIQSAHQLARHMKRVLNTDLNYPIILNEEGFIMDGWHRVTKALLEGRETIKAVRFEKTPPPDMQGENHAPHR